MKLAITRVLLFVLMLCLLFGATGCSESQADGSESVLDEESQWQSESESESKKKYPVFPGSDSTSESQKNAPDADEDDHLKILAIGNSFSVDGMQYLWNICKAAGVEKVTLGNLYIGGCSLDKHWSKISGKQSAYKYYKNTAGQWTATEDVSVQTAMADEYWDVITVQQASGSSGVPDTYGKLGNILDWIEEHKLNEDAKIFWHMTWAYQEDSDHKDFSNYNKTQMTMYQAITDTVQAKILTDDRIDGVIPSGTAIQNLRSSYVGDTVTRDGYHLHWGIGRYTAGLTWFAALTGQSVDSITWVPDSYKSLSTQLSVIRESVKNAMQTPYAVTASQYTTEPALTDEELLRSANLDPTQYELLDLQMTLQSYHHATNDCLLHTTGNTAKLWSASRKLTKSDLPVGSVIIVDQGYRYRPDAWVEANTPLSTTRPTVVSSQMVLVTESWWGSYTLRGFNLGHADGSTHMTAGDHAHLRIYVPK